MRLASRALALLAGAALLVTPIAASAQYTLNVRDADVRAFVADAAQVTGRTFVVDGRVQGKVSVVSQRPLTRSEYFEVFLSTLRANGLIAVPIGNGAFRIQPVEGAAAQPMRIGMRGAARNQMVTEIVRLGVLDAGQVLETVRPLVSKEGSVTANRAGNSLVIVDYVDNLRRIRQLLASLEGDGSSTQTVLLEHAGAREIATALSSLVPADGAGGRSLATVVAVDGASAVLLRGDRSTVNKLAALARQLDARAAATGEIKVIWLDYADAGALVPMLERLVGGGGGEAASGSAAPATLGGVTGSATEPGTRASGNASAQLAGGSGSTVSASTSGSSPIGATQGGMGSGAIELAGGKGTATITRYPGANAVIISAPADVQRRLSELVRQLDVRQDQVLVEAIIVEVSNDVARKLGLQLLIGGKDIPFAATNFSNAAPNIVTLAGGALANKIDQTTTVINGNVVTTTTNSSTGDLLRQQAAQAALAATGGFAGFATNFGNNRYLAALLNAVQSDTNSNILSTPHITTNNNVPASILFGQEIPISTGEALSQNFQNTFRTIQRQNVGIELDVTPQINAGNEVRLDLRQEVSSIAGPVSDRFSELVINKREIKTTVTVGNGEILVLGGLLDDNERRTIEKVPGLGDVPLLGQLFRSRGKSRVKTNLMVFIRPTILRNAADREALTARRYGVIRDAQGLFDPKAEPTIDALITDYMGAALPGTPPAAQPGDVTIRPRADAGAAPAPAAVIDGELPPKGP